MPKKCLVCGGRDYADRDYLFSVLDWARGFFDMMLVIHGGARGADLLAGAWAADRGVAVVAYHAQWKLFGNSAGPRRNQQMLDDAKPDVVIAFPGGTGTADMVARARRAKCLIVLVGPREIVVQSPERAAAG